MNDEEAIQAVLDGNKEKFAFLVDRYYQEALRFVVRMLGNREDAEDIVQDTFIRVYRGLDRYDHRGKFKSWLYKILVNRCRSHAVSDKRRTERSIKFDPAIHGVSQVEDSRLREIMAVLDEFDPGHRSVFLLKYLEEMSYPEIAEITGEGISAMKMQVKRIKDRLRSRLAGKDDRL